MNRDLVIERLSEGTATVLRPMGDIDMARAPAMRSAVAAAVRDRPPTLILDLSQVSYVDSSGIATLVEALQVSIRNKVRLVLVGINPRVQSAFEITRLVGLFTISETVTKAAAP